MFRELAVFVCLAGVISASHIYHDNSAAYSSTLSPLEVSTVHNNIPVEAKILQSLSVNGHSQGAYSAQEQVTQYQGVSSSESVQDSSQGITYSISPAVVKTISRPVANKVTVESHQHVTAHPPPITRVSNQAVPVQQLVQTVSQPPFVSVTAHPPSASVVTSTVSPYPAQSQTVTRRPAIQYVPVAQGGYSEVVNTVPEKKVTIESHQSVTAHPSTLSLPRPVQTLVHPPAVQIISSAVAQNLPVSLPAAGIYESVAAYPPPSYVSPIFAPQPVHQVQTIVNRPIVQYVPAPVRPVRPVIVKPKPVTIESHRSVTVHPPTRAQTIINPVQYVSSPAAYPVSPSVVTQGSTTVIQQGSSNVQYASSPAPSKPIPVPVFYTAEEANDAKYVSVNTRPASSVISRPTPVRVSQPISVPVEYRKGAAFIRYNSDLPTPLVYTKSLVEKDHASADLVATHIVPRYGNYARALSYSPASAASSVNFNGLGVSYGW